ncbi:sugar kinase [Elizabethkingia miricola]|uniref:PfkB family carbohydrate kinase n=1 Tax=Elizabethkingia miricola TaxID=172045 RepID=A0AAQ1PGS4_ELIMR|nr:MULTISPECIES: PfkB family carbohydrate kinase [Elizabethkingia]KUG11675.1 sugar kinase [Elizabethkingia miricola]KUY20255.1 sugar kinase [Elizabethkingia miricola]MCL1653569.1 PfkB family carbohydrate kinase [Elizabethkingia miricola]MCL1656416.1 PfkB family carbohydrate kinase [Elizabethkingia miricola]MCL1679056.1 PfkB family carbohydrate kinase [Elizabethkingia miricola]
MKLLSVGTVAFDAIETPFGKTDKILGGAATYIGLAASVLDTDVHLVSVVGGDFPDEYLDMMKGKNINVDGVEVVEDGKTFFWAGKYHNDLNTRDTLATELNVLENFDPKIPEGGADAEILMLGNLHPAVQLAVLERMKERPKLVVLDTMNFWMDLTWDLLMDVIAKTDVITINDEEARQLSGEYSLVKAAKKIHALGPKYVIIKKGEHGALLFEDGKVFAIPALLLEDVFDPTGAGDTFAGGFVAHLAKCEKFDFESMKTALIVGSALASFTVEEFGTEKIQTVTPAMLKERIKQFKELTTFEELV